MNFIVCESQTFKLEVLALKFCYRSFISVGVSSDKLVAIIL